MIHVSSSTCGASGGIRHQWSKLPDVANTMLALIERNGMISLFHTYHMAGHWNDDGMQMTQAIRCTVLRNQLIRLLQSIHHVPSLPRIRSQMRCLPHVDSAPDRVTLTLPEIPGGLNRYQR